jgi:L-alanine-DL-glutamate epimerase-like enolase superfamily enzyme
MGWLAPAHMAARLKDMLAMENHSMDIPWWGDLVTGPTKQIVDHGYITVPDAPGLGIELNHDEGGYFAPRPWYDDYILDRFRQGGPYPHLENGKHLISR